MTEGQKRLFKLANFLRTKEESEFDICYLGHKSSCGTVCCAIGWAGLMPEFTKEGLRTTFNDKLDADITLNIDGVAIGWGIYDCAKKFFGLSTDDTHRLFFPISYIDEEEITLKVVADRIENYALQFKKEDEYAIT